MTAAPRHNVVLDVSWRGPWLADSAAVLAANHRGQFVGHVSAASLPTIFSIVRRNADVAKGLRVVSECLASFDVVPVDRKALELAGDANHLDGAHQFGRIGVHDIGPAWNRRKRR